MIQSTTTGSRQSFANPQPATRNVTVRKSVYDLTQDEIVALQKTFAGLQAISDNRGYQYLASIHGLNQYYCAHGNRLFLIWHRPFLVMFEQAMQAITPGIGLPYWDWTTDRAENEGIPQMFTAATYVDPASGKKLLNPLLSAAISFKNPNKWAETFRSPAPSSALKSLRTLVEKADKSKTYDRFCPQVEQPHNGLHGWVGGCMGQVPYAAFDPVFWVHHCFIEKLFCDWQDRYGASIPTSIAGQTLAPFSTTTNAVWDYKSLGYRYVNPQVAPGPLMRALKNVPRGQRPHAVFDLGSVPDQFQQADLHFIKAEVPRESFEVRVYFSKAKPGSKTATSGAAGYAGSLYTFGHGTCTGDMGHCAVPEVPETATQFILVRPEHHLTPQRLTLDVTEALRRAKSKSSDGALCVHLVLVDPKGKPLPESTLDYEMLTLDAV
jgi:tyrosinase